MPNLTPEIKTELKDVIYNFFAEECEVELEKLNDQTNIIDDLDGDSLLFVELIELMKKKYKLDIQLQTIGKYMLKNPVNSLGEVVKTSYLIYEYGNDIVNLENIA
jgi:acyl carrier protein